MIRPRCRHRRRQHIAQALVKHHASHTRGHWWWKQTHQSIMVRFRARSLVNARGQTWGNIRMPRDLVEIGFGKKDVRDQFPIGSEIYVAFSIVGTRSSPQFIWEGVKKIKPVSFSKENSQLQEAHNDKPR
ncbi:MAG: hypothetical protein AAB534_02840 [Patescibacteria group bacterium]